MRGKKIRNYTGAGLWRYTTTAKNPLDAQVVRMFEQNMPPVFLPFSVVQSSPASSEINFEIERYITLSQYIASSRTAAELSIALSQFHQVLEVCLVRRLPLKNIIFDANQVYCDPWANHALRFVCLPIEGLIPDIQALRAFFADFSKRVICADGHAQQLMDRHDSFFQSTTSFNPGAYVEFLTDLLNNTQSTEKKQDQKKRDKKQREKTPVEQGRHARIDPGTGVLDQIDFAAFEAGASIDLFAKQKLPSQVKDSQSTTVLEELIEEEASCTPLPEQENDPLEKSKKSSRIKTRFYLRRQSTGEQFEITGDRFVVGKSKHSSYQIKGTATVSRSHAIFQRLGDECWVEDDNSTNGTYVDGQQLKPRVRCLLKDAQVVCMSDENFTLEVMSD